MKIEKWKYNDTEIDVPVFEDDEIEKNEDIEYLEITKDLTEVLEKLGDTNAD